jgi:CubicO group peptidase (beta-lactamase class C family)
VTDERREAVDVTERDDTGQLGSVFDRLRALIAAGELPGAGLAIARGGDLVAEWYGGWAAPERPAHPETLWPLASISKSYTATAIMALVEQGALTLSLPVSTLLPRLTDGGREVIRLGHLLTHTSGLIYESPRMEALLVAHTSLPAILEDVYTQPLLFPPGTRYSYSDLGYALAATAAEAATGQAFPALLRALVLEPGELRETFLPPAPDDERLAQVVGSLAYDTDGAMYNSPHALALAHPAFGVVASARDLLRFGLLFAPGGQRRVLAEATIRAMTRDHLRSLALDGPHRIYPPAPEAYGLGLAVTGQFLGVGDDLASEESFGHDGASGCILLVDPAYDLTIALVTNRHIRSDPDRFAFRLTRVVNGVLAALTRREEQR